MGTTLGGKQYAIIALTLITAAIHLFLGVTQTPINTLFILNAVGYVVLIVALYFIPQLAAQRSLIRWLLILFAAATFILYFVFNWPNVTSPLGLITKGIELILIILLLTDHS